MIYLSRYILTHWGRVTHICVSKSTIIGSDNGLLPGRRHAIIWNNVGILLIGPLDTIFNEISIAIHQFSFQKIHFKMSSGKWWPSCLGLNVLKTISLYLKSSCSIEICWDGLFFQCGDCSKCAMNMEVRQQSKKILRNGIYWMGSCKTDNSPME